METAMTDRELLELAAKAAGYVYLEHKGYDDEDDEYVTHRWIRDHNNALIKWNPLTDDGDALRLAVKLGLEIECNPPSDQTAVRKSRGDSYVWCNHDDDPYAATRRAIVRAAAEIGKNM